MQRGSRTTAALRYVAVALGGVRYAILPESALIAACRRGGVALSAGEGAAPSTADAALPEQLDTQRLARRIAERRKGVGLSQAELARRAGVRVETLNRIERGHVTPDFSTIRKLVEAMTAAETTVFGPADKR